MDRRKSMSKFMIILKLLHVINYKFNNNFNWKEEKKMNILYGITRILKL
jgi:hypothetical protein